MTRVFLGSVLVALSIFTCSTSALKILGISTLPSPSHHVWFTELMKGLARNGHEIYALGIQLVKFDDDEATRNRTKSFILDVIERSHDSEIFDPLEWSKFPPVKMAWIAYEASHEFCKMEMATEGAKEVLELVKNTKIDVIVQDVMHGQCFYGLQEIAQGNPTFVGFNPFGSGSWIKEFVGGNNWPAIRHYAYHDHLAPFSIWGKTLNFIYHEIDNILREYLYMPKQQEIAEEFIGKKMSRSLIEIEKNMSVLLINSYPAFEPAIYLPPNVIEVGGLQVKDPKPLPKDIKAFLDGAEHGVIVISLGTNVPIHVLGRERLEAMITALGQLKQRVLWKFDADELTEMPKNIMIKKWLPQGDVLAHPNMRVLWCHTGLLSVQEAIWRGVPVIGMPFFMDQPTNIELLVRKGVGLRLDFESLTTERILQTLDKILNDPSFALRMKQFSQVYKDRPMSPIDLAVWHVEHAARHPHGPLVSPGRDLSRVQLNLIDVYAVLAVAILLIIWILRLLFRGFLNLLCPQHKVETAQKLKRN